MHTAHVAQQFLHINCPQMNENGQLTLQSWNPWRYHDRGAIHEASL